MKEFKDGIYNAYLTGGTKGSGEFTYEFSQKLMEDKMAGGKGGFSSLNSAVSLFYAYQNMIQYFIDNDNYSQCEDWLSGNDRNLVNSVPKDLVASLTSSMGNFLESRASNEYDFSANIESIQSKSIATLSNSQFQNDRCNLFNELLGVIDNGTDIDRATFVNAVLFEK